eukprot:GGOE01054758.1.p1 GENE.GGOE01054758.1~~GGOE01054758.1.p1  ORF type:complete len:326 (+),score=91.03 GGOE01054758.1:163-1140(+)
MGCTPRTPPLRLLLGLLLLFLGQDGRIEAHELSSTEYHPPKFSTFEDAATTTKHSQLAVFVDLRELGVACPVVAQVRELITYNHSTPLTAQISRLLSVSATDVSLAMLYPLAMLVPYTVSYPGSHLTKIDWYVPANYTSVEMVQFQLTYRSVVQVEVWSDQSCVQPIVVGWEIMAELLQPAVYTLTVSINMPFAISLCSELDVPVTLVNNNTEVHLIEVHPTTDLALRFVAARGPPAAVPCHVQVIHGNPHETFENSIIVMIVFLCVLGLLLCPAFALGLLSYLRRKRQTAANAAPPLGGEEAEHDADDNDSVQLVAIGGYEDGA